MTFTPKGKFISLTVTALFLLWVFYYIYNNWEQFQNIRLITFKGALLLLGVAFINLFVQVVVLKAGISPFVKLKTIECFGVKVVQLAVNYVIPFGGLGFIFHYLYKKYELSYSEIISSFTAPVLIQFLVFSLGGIVSIIINYLNSGIIPKLILLLLTSIALGLGAVFVFFKSYLLKSNNKLSMKINNLLSSWYIIRNDIKYIWQMMLWKTVEFLSFSTFYFYAFRVFDIHIPYSCALLVTCLSTISLIFRVTPAALGTYEVAIIYAIYIFGFTVPDALIVIGVVRLINLLLYLLLSPLFLYILTGRITPQQDVKSV